ncbi:MAG: hypothetical protein ACFFAI_02980 [Promethearchaeota archaeon]
MKSIIRKILILLAVGMVFAIVANSNYSFIVYQWESNVIVDYREEFLPNTSDQHTITIRPNGDVLTEWPIDPTPHWSRIDEPVFTGDITDGNIVSYSFSSTGDISEIFDMQTTYIGNGIITEIELVLYGNFQNYIEVSLNLGGWIVHGDTIIGGLSWHSLIWSNLYGNNADLEDLQIKLTALDVDTLDVGFFDALYCNITYEFTEIPGMPIEIFTPEERRYNEPMSGFYPASYGFENESNGNQPSGWMVDATAKLAGTARILDFHNTHRKVVELCDAVEASGNNIRVTKTFDNDTTHGDIELWLSTTDTSKDSVIEIMSSASGIAFFIRIDDNNWRDNVQSILQKASGGDMDTPLNNSWHHIRLTFETTTSNYEGLGEYQWKVWVDGIESVAQNFVNNYTSIDQIRIRTKGLDANYFIYFDAVAYSWDPYYSVGNNLYEGLLVSFWPNNMNWMRYSLDGQSNITIFGDTTIPIPDDGTHTIQIFGINPLGTTCHSEITYFETRVYSKLLSIEIVEQSFSIDVFNITFLVADEEGIGIENATIQAWWNETFIAANNIEDLGNGLYLVPLNPILVIAGEDPVLLNITVSAEGYQTEYYETYFAIDPDVIDKDVQKPPDNNTPFIIILTITSIFGGIGVAGVILFLLAKKRGK